MTDPPDAHIPPSPAGDPVAADPVGRKIGRYTILRRIGRGGMGEVFLADDPLLRSRVALKRLAPRFSGSEKHRKRILKEARRARAINDRRIATLYDVLEHEGQILLVMEYVEGRSFREILRKRQSLESFWSFAAECLKGLSVAHSHGILHGDIKPENVMLTSKGQLKILDFGLARRFPLEDLSTTVSLDSIDGGGIAGTPAYMAPEAFHGEKLDARADIYSLGVFFYEYLAGRRPFRGKTFSALLREIQWAEPEPIRAANPDVSPALATIVTRMLAKDTADRFDSCVEILQRLDIARTTPWTRLDRLRQLLVPWARRSLLPVAVAALLLLAWQLNITDRIRNVVVPARLPDSRYAAVLPFTFVDEAESREPFALGMTGFVRDGLQRLTSDPSFQLGYETGITQQLITDPATARELLGVNLVIVTSLEEKKHDLAAVVTLLEAATGRVLRTSRVTSPAARPDDFLDSLFTKTAELLALDAGDTPPAELMAYGTEGAGTLRFTLEGFGHLNRRNGEDEIRRAIERLDLACKLEPGNATSRAGLATAYYELFRTSRDSVSLSLAETLAREAIDLDEENAGAHRVLARIHTASDRIEAAQKELERALVLDPTNDQAWYELGRLYWRRSLFEDAERVYRNAAAARPHTWRPVWWLANQNFQLGRFDDARRGFEEMIRRAPDLYLGHQDLAGLLIFEADYETAIAELRKAIDLHPTDQAYTFLGTTEFNMRRFEDAAKAFNQAFQYGLARYDLWLNLGDAYYFSPGGRDDAMHAYGQAIRLGREEVSGAPGDAVILANLSCVFARVGEPDSARAYVRTALENAPSNPLVQYGAALTTWQLGDTTEALNWLEAAVRGGYPLPWIRDSAVFDQWHVSDRFRQIAAAGDPGAEETSNP